ncbi:transposase [Ralstonia sp.]|uniref:transposase n=1 Tax=Ralstonia sp. TaxID=54061 RepID=UPI00338F93F3
MKRSRFSEEQIAYALRLAESGTPVVDVCRQLGLADAGAAAVTGAEVEACDDASLRELAVRVTAFARANPEHMLRLVRALQAEGQIVAMTGDGVNEARAGRCGSRWKNGI